MSETLNSIYCVFDKDEYSADEYVQIFTNYLLKQHKDDLDQLLVYDDKLAHYPLYVK